MKVLESASAIGAGLGLFFQTDSRAVFVYMDGTLRLIPNAATFQNLYSGQINPSAYHLFPNAAAAPHPIGRPLMDGALLCTILAEPDKGILLTDRMPWAPAVTVLRHVINPQQMADFGFDWQKVVEYEDNPLFDVPLAVDTNKNINAAQALAGHRAVFHALFLHRPMNPFFNYLLKGTPAAVDEAMLRLQIRAAQAVVNSLPDA